MTAKSKVPPHVFQPDPDVPPDPLSPNTRRVCRCGLLGQPGDSHHTMPDVPGADVRQRAAGDNNNEGE